MILGCFTWFLVNGALFCQSSSLGTLAWYFCLFICLGVRVELQVFWFYDSPLSWTTLHFPFSFYIFFLFTCTIQLPKSTYFAPFLPQKLWVRKISLQIHLSFSIVSISLNQTRFLKLYVLWNLFLVFQCSHLPSYFFNIFRFRVYLKFCCHSKSPLGQPFTSSPLLSIQIFLVCFSSPWSLVVGKGGLGTR